MKRLPLALLLCLLAPGARAEEPIPVPMRGIEIEERLGASVPLDVPLVDQAGKAVMLRDYMKPGRPLILTLNYYSCPTLCGFVLQGVLAGLKGLAFTPGREFQVATVSIDHREQPALAAAKRGSYLSALGRPIEEGAWPFLTGREADLKRLADAVGFHYRWDPEGRQYAHAAGIFVLTPEGRVSRVLYGIEFRPRDLRLALVEASRGGIGSPVDRLLLFCYHYDPKTRVYGLTPMGVMRIGGVLTVFFLSVLLLIMWRRERRASVVHDESGR